MGTGSREQLTERSEGLERSERAEKISVEGIFAAHAHQGRSGTSDGVRVSYEKKKFASMRVSPWSATQRCQKIFLT